MADILAAIRESVESRGYPPSVREIGDPADLVALAVRVAAVGEGRHQADGKCSALLIGIHGIPPSPEDADDNRRRPALLAARCAA